VADSANESLLGGDYLLEIGWGSWENGVLSFSFFSASEAPPAMTASPLICVRYGFVWVFFFSLSFSLASLAFVGEVKATVTVQTVDGRKLRGEVDQRTTEEHLWIRREANQVMLASSVAWDSIVAAAIDGRAVDVSTLVEQWPGLKSRGPVGILSLPVKSPSRFRETRFPTRAKGSRIVALEIDAALVNLDRDVEPDGFELVIAALDEHGQAVPVRGNLSAWLVGERDEQHSGRIRFEELQRWRLVSISKTVWRVTRCAFGRFVPSSIGS